MSDERYFKLIEITVSLHAEKSIFLLVLFRLILGSFCLICIVRAVSFYVSNLLRNIWKSRFFLCEGRLTLQLSYCQF